mmetsp:Transcript_1944/g.2814  ORF Transcript_1944/g.2814 Transcript_1944/m.2814 type:complete len:228 (-) Transcript_1944:8-691(-)
MSCSFLCCCFSSEPPDSVSANGRTGNKHASLMRLQSRPNAFQTNLCDAPCKEPLSCCCTGLFPCCLAPQWRLAVLEQYGRGIDDYVCCQGYVPKVCCCDFPEMGRGDSCCMWLEGCLCDTLSLSFTRIYLMDAKQLHPDPVDYQIIRFSNCMQVLACICNFAAIFDKNLRELAHIIDWVAEIVERVVAGCLGGQIMAELRHSKRLLSGGDGGLGANLVTANPVKKLE